MRIQIIYTQKISITVDSSFNFSLQTHQIIHNDDEQPPVTATRRVSLQNQLAIF
jgi:hypothetical protein